jgi:hypothetical protein
MIPPLEMQHSDDQGTQLSRENVKKFVKVLEDNPLLDGVLIEDIVFSGAVTVNIAHTLDRNPRGWIITDLTGGLVDVARNVGDWDDKFLSLASSAACTISVWVF